MQSLNLINTLNSTAATLISDLSQHLEQRPVQYGTCFIRLIKKKKSVTPVSCSGPLFLLPENEGLKVSDLKYLFSQAKRQVNLSESEVSLVYAVRSRKARPV